MQQRRQDLPVTGIIITATDSESSNDSLQGLELVVPEAAARVQAELEGADSGGDVAQGDHTAPAKPKPVPAEFAAAAIPSSVPLPPRELGTPSPTGKPESLGPAREVASGIQPRPLEPSLPPPQPQPPPPRKAPQVDVVGLGLDDPRGPRDRPREAEEPESDAAVEEAPELHTGPVLHDLHDPRGSRDRPREAGRSCEAHEEAKERRLPVPGPVAQRLWAVRDHPQAPQAPEEEATEETLAVQGPLAEVVEEIIRITQRAEKDSAAYNRGDPLRAWNVYAQAVAEFEAMILERGWPRREETARPASRLYVHAAARALKCHPVQHAVDMGITLAERAVELDPLSAQALVHRAWALSLCRDWSRAVEDLQSALRLDPTNASALRELPHLQKIFEQWRERARDHERFEMANAAKEDGNWLFDQGQYHAASLQYLRGLDAFDDVGSESDASRKLRALLCCNTADALLRSGDAEDEMVRVMAGAALEIQPQNPRALLLRGLAHRNARRWELASADFHEVLCLDPENTVAQQELLQMQGSGVQQHEGSARAAFAKGEHLAMQGLYSEAASVYLKGMRQLEAQPSKDPQLRGPLLGGLAESLLRCGEIEEVCEMTCKYLEESTLDVDSLRWRACAYIQAQEFTLARDDLLEARRLDPDCFAVQQELKLVEDLLPLQEELELHRRAEGRLFDSMIAAARDDRDSGNQLFAARAYAAALEAYQTGVRRFAELQPHHLSVAAKEVKTALCCNVAQVALLLDDDDDGGITKAALSASEQALKLDPGNVKALFRRGCAFARSGSWSLARQDLQAVLVIHPKENRQGEATIRRFQHLAESELAKIATVAPVPKRR